jgi:hypothetical protein
VIHSKNLLCLAALAVALASCNKSAESVADTMERKDGMVKDL